MLHNEKSIAYQNLSRLVPYLVNHELQGMVEVGESGAHLGYLIGVSLQVLDDQLM